MCWRFQLYCILLIEVLSFSQNMGSLKTSKCACNKPDSQKLFLHFGENGPIGGSKYKQNLFWLREPNCVGTRRTHFACTSNNVGPVVFKFLMLNWQVSLAKAGMANSLLQSLIAVVPISFVMGLGVPCNMSSVIMSQRNNFYGNHTYYQLLFQEQSDKCLFSALLTYSCVLF